VRDENYNRTQKKYKDQDNVAHRAGKDHHVDVEDLTAKKIAQVLTDAQN